MSTFSLIYGSASFLIGFIFNAIMLYCIVRTHQRAVGIISNLFVFLGIINIISLFSFMSLSPVIYCVEGRTLFVSEGFVKEESYGHIFFNIFYGTLVTVFGSLAQCFFYRYLILCKPNWYAAIVTKTGKFLNSLVGALFVIHFTWSCAYSLQPTEETSAFFQQLDIFSYINFNKVVYQTVSLTDLTETGSKFLIFLSLLLNNFIMFFVIVFCSAKIYLKLHSHKYETNHSVTNVQSHGKVFRILLIQTIIPVIAFMAPLTACTYYVIAKIQSGIYGNFFMASAYPFFGVCYPLSTLVLVKTYSNYIKSKIFKSSPASVKVSTIVDRLNSHNNL